MLAMLAPGKNVNSVAVWTSVPNWVLLEESEPKVPVLP